MLALAAGCSRDESASEPRARGPILAPPPEIANFPPPSLRAGESDGRTTTIVAGPVGADTSAILEAFQDDLSACARLVETLRSDSALANRLERVLGSDTDAMETVLARSRTAETKEMRHLLANLDQAVRVEYRPQGDPYAAAILQNRGIACVPTRARLLEIERLGPSESAWTLREYFLTGSLRGLRMPWSAGEGVEFDELREEIETAARVHRGPNRPRFEAWLGRAIDHLRREQASAEATTPEAKALERHQGTVSAWIATLEGIRSIRSGPTALAR